MEKEAGRKRPAINSTDILSEIGNCFNLNR